jgi:hypothetical protein
MAAKWKWSCFCKNEESHIFTAGDKDRRANTWWGLALALVVISATGAQAQTPSPAAKAPAEAPMTAAETQKFSRHKLMFSLFDKNGNQLTGSAISSGKVRVYTLREPKTITHSHLTYDRVSKYFTFAESAVSPGMMLAFVTATDIMYVSLYGRAAERILDGIQVQNGSYVLSSNDFGSQKQLKVASWAKYLEDEVAPQQQDLTSYQAQLKDKRPVELVDHAH